MFVLIAPQTLAQEVVEGVEIDGDIRFSEHEGATLDWGSNNFEVGCIIDENTHDDTDCFGEDESVLIIDPTSAAGATDPNIHEGGDKLALPEGWNIISGNVPAKDDLGNIYAWKQDIALDSNSDAAGDTILYTGWEREVNNGESYVDFEFNARIISWDGVDSYNICVDGFNIDGTPSPSTLNGVLDANECPNPIPGNAEGMPGRSPDDFVLSYKLDTVTGSSGQIQSVQLILLQADENGQLDFANPVFDILVDNPTDLTDLGNGKDLLNGVEGICVDDSGDPETCPAQTLVAALNNAVIDAGPWGTFQKNANKIGDDMVDVANFTELALNLNNVDITPSCPGTAFLTVKSKSSSSDTADLKDTARPVNFDLTNCGEVEIIKLTQGSAVGTFDFDHDLVQLGKEIGDGTNGEIDLTLVTVASGAPSSFDGKASFTFLTVDPGNYTVSERAPTGFDFDSVSCFDQDEVEVASSAISSIVSFDLEQNGKVTCTYINVQPKLELTKQILPCGLDTDDDGFIDNDPGIFVLQIKDDTDTVVASAAVGQLGTTGKQSLSLGTYTLDEIAGNGTDLDHYFRINGNTFANPQLEDCFEANGDFKATLSSGADDKKCTITNVRKPQVTVTKYVINGLEGDVFDLQVDDDTIFDDAGNGDSASTLLSDLVDASVDQFVGPTVGEVAGNGSTDLLDYTTQIVCDKVDPNTAEKVSAFFGPGNTNDRELTLPNLTAGETVTCDITNTLIPDQNACLNATTPE
jgi:hypothetical protein